MRRIVTSAPGKVVLCGEYAVLDGATGLSMAVDRRARVDVTRSPGDFCEVRSPGFGNAAFRARQDGCIEWHDEAAAERLGLFEHVWRAAPARPDGAWSFELDTASFADAGTSQKLGFGSSAALAVALSRALSGLAGESFGAAGVACAAHRSFQGGRGSGIDVASSLAGGVIEYRRGTTATAAGWPAGLEYAILWSGRASNTADRVARYAPGAHARRLGAASAEVVRRWRGDNPVSLLDALRGYVGALAALDSALGLGIFDAGHGDIAAQARRAGVVYKPCGAGGGDVGIVLSEDRSKVREFVGEAERRGFRRLEASLDTCGVRVELQEDD